MQWLSGLYYAGFISFYSPTQLCGGGTTKSNFNELPIFCPTLTFLTAESFGISFIHFKNGTDLYFFVEFLNLFFFLKI